MSAILVVVEAATDAIADVALEDARGELTSLGWEDVLEVRVVDEATAATAALAALQGRAVLVDARAARSVVDQLCDDLRRLGRLDHRVWGDRVDGDRPLLTEDEHALLRLLGEGVSLGGAAQALHVSRRSADRRLAAARQALEADSTGAAVAAYRRRLARLPRPANEAGDQPLG